MYLQQNTLIKPSYLSAARLGLIDWLENQTDLDWRYYDSSISPGQGAKGGVRVYRITDESPNEAIVMEYAPWKVTAQLRLLIAHQNAEELESLLLDWHTELTTLLHQLAFEGLHGTYRDIPLQGAMKGIRPSPKGCQLATEEVMAAQGAGDIRSWKGLLLTEFDFDYEINYELGW